MAGPPSRSTFPSSPGEPTSRRLGVGSGGGGDKPLRAQIVVALVAVSILIAVPLYLLRRPNGKAKAVADTAALADAGRPAPSGSAAAVLAPPAPPAPAKPPEALKLGPPQRVRCGASATGRHEGNLCDALPYFEEALVKAIREGSDCAPKSSQEGSLNYVLNIDFQKKALHLFPGASGQWHGRKARRAVKCVLHALPNPDWAAIQHQYRFYSIAVLTTYLATGSAPTQAKNPAGTPNFE